MFIKKNLITAWEAVMDETKNPLHNLPLQTAHMIMQILAWMWSTIFSVVIGGYVAFGITAIGHSLLIAGVIVTLMVFRNADNNNKELVS